MTKDPTGSRQTRHELSDQAASPRFLASDNTSGICPQALEYLLAANRGDVPAYGNDDWTARASNRFRELFETDCEVFFVFNGTAANSLALATLCQPYQSVICHQLAHIETDECGGPEFFSNGAKLLSVPGDDGKVAPLDVERMVVRRRDIHYPQPRALSITQSTEVGTLYRPDELAALREMADRHGLKVHMDGARFANACAALDLPPRALSWEAGVDVLCFSGTKNGTAVGEAVIFFDRELARGFEYRCKQAGQLASKMRFIAAPWLGLIETGAWCTNAVHANAMARHLGTGLEQLGLTPMFPVQANAVFVDLPAKAQRYLKDKGWTFYTFIGDGGARFVCAWDTSKEAVDALLEDVRAGLAGVGMQSAG
ncbi:threonine aldolase family protein [Halotalea alkalilenta]|uniref:L-threonine aldolase n=1 Tax=Halotalea alkalilenta TaxID=376489 RepID=A0A172YHW2_9GAMM|nr:low specificity L-threonine aldolase [Halotalea alkalilenta]ANF58585.1 threonine aldolase [Halotalea alkalilenta]